MALIRFTFIHINLKNLNNRSSDFRLGNEDEQGERWHIESGGGRYEREREKRRRIWIRMEKGSEEQQA